MSRRRAAAVLPALYLALAAPAVLPAQTARPDPGLTSMMRPAILKDVGIEQRLGSSLPLDVILQDEQGRPVRLGRYFGARPVILVLAYYNCPMLCTQVLNGLVSSMRALSFDAGREFEVVTLSFDPRDRPRDAAAKKEPYLREYNRPGAAAGWHFLTGGPGSIERVASAVGFRFRWDNDLAQFAHASGIFVLTPDGKLSRYFFGIEYAPRDLRLGLIEASNRKIGNPVDQILLYCYHYDPKVGKYGAVIMNIVRLAGVGAVLVLSTFLFVMWRRDRRRDAADPRLTRPPRPGEAH
ncbi:MAG: SCO family protein [Acidobacteria bacterium]|nr:SCO family protein [Acidobacteriota bacterium]MCA1609816.1 SCO family protein [Acidobacteriota bacterium]